MHILVLKGNTKVNIHTVFERHMPVCEIFAYHYLVFSCDLIKNAFTSKHFDFFFMLYASSPQTEQNNHECMRSATIVFIMDWFIDHFPRTG